MRLPHWKSATGKNARISIAPRIGSRSDNTRDAISPVEPRERFKKNEHMPDERATGWYKKKPGLQLQSVLNLARCLLGSARMGFSPFRSH
jgi:hypothetical protein